MDGECSFSLYLSFVIAKDILQMMLRLHSVCHVFFLNLPSVAFVKDMFHLLCLKTVL